MKLGIKSKYTKLAELFTCEDEPHYCYSGRSSTLYLEFPNFLTPNMRRRKLKDNSPRQNTTHPNN